MNDNDWGNLRLIIIGALVFIASWGVMGLIEGDGFFGGIGKQFDAIGRLVAMVLKGAVILGALWLGVQWLSSKEHKPEK